MNISPVVIVALVVGTIAILSACFVWVRHRTFGLGGGVLTGFGVILMLISVISEVRFEVSSSGARIEILRQQLTEAVEAVSEVAQEAQQLATQLEMTERNMRHLTEVVRRAPMLPDDARVRLRDSVQIPPAFQPRLDSAIANLSGIQRTLTSRPWGGP